MTNTEARFAARELEIRRICRSDNEFASIWEDYRQVQQVLRRLAEAPEPDGRALAHYRRLSGELAEEIDARLEGGG